MRIVSTPKSCTAIRVIRRHSTCWACCAIARRLAEADQLLQAALAMQPDWPDALTNYGLLLHALGRYLDALAAYDRALAINARHVNALTNRSYALNAMKRYSEALAYADLALALAPDYALAHNNRGCALHKLKHNSEEVASLDPGGGAGTRPVGRLLQPWQHLARSRSRRRGDCELCAGIELNPSYLRAINNLGNLLVELGRADEAMPVFSRGVEIGPNDAMTINNRGNALQAVNRHQVALSLSPRARNRASISRRALQCRLLMAGSTNWNQ